MIPMMKISLPEPFTKPADKKVFSVQRSAFREKSLFCFI